MGTRGKGNVAHITRSVCSSHAAHSRCVLSSVLPRPGAGPIGFRDLPMAFNPAVDHAAVTYGGDVSTLCYVELARLRASPSSRGRRTLVTIRAGGRPCSWAVVAFKRRGIDFPALSCVSGVVVPEPLHQVLGQEAFFAAQLIVGRGLEVGVGDRPQQELVPNRRGCLISLAIQADHGHIANHVAAGHGEARAINADFLAVPATYFCCGIAWLIAVG